MDQRMLLIGILVLYGSCAGLALKCYVCTNLQIADCLHNVRPDLLQECPTGTTACTTEIRRDRGEVVYRTCAASNWVCRYECSTCTRDGCNSGNEIEEVTPNSTVEITFTEIVMANIYGIGAIALVVVLLLIWAITKACSRNKDEDDDDDEDYDFDEVDEEDEDSIDKEYEEYEEEAEEEYNKIKQRGEESV